MFPQQGLNYIKCARVRSKSHVILTNNISLLQVTRKQKHLKELMKLRPDLVGVPFMVTKVTLFLLKLVSFASFIGKHVNSSCFLI